MRSSILGATGSGGQREKRVGQLCLEGEWMKIVNKSHSAFFRDLQWCNFTFGECSFWFASLWERLFLVDPKILEDCNNKSNTLLTEQSDTQESDQSA